MISNKHYLINGLWAGISAIALMVASTATCNWVYLTEPFTSFGLWRHCSASNPMNGPMYAFDGNSSLGAAEAFSIITIVIGSCAVLLHALAHQKNSDVLMMFTVVLHLVAFVCACLVFLAFDAFHNAQEFDAYTTDGDGPYTCAFSTFGFFVAMIFAGLDFWGDDKKTKNDQGNQGATNSRERQGPHIMV